MQFNRLGATAALVSYLRGVSLDFKKVLDQATYAATIGQVVEGVVRRACAPLLQAGAVDLECGQQLIEVYDILLGLEGLFPCNSYDQESESDSGAGLVQSQKSPYGREANSASTCVYSWETLRALHIFLGCNTEQITEKLSLRAFSSLTAPQLSRLVRASFDNTPKRKNLLDKIAKDTRHLES